MAAAVLHCKSDSVNCSTAYYAGDPHHFPCWHRETTHNGCCLLHHLNTQQVAHAGPSGNHQWESAHLPTTNDASSKHPTINWLKRPRPSCK